MFVRIFFLFLIVPTFSKQFEDDLNTQESSQVEVRAVFINCQIDEKQLQYANEISRFQREEFFKHNALRDCQKKLAVTVKMTSNHDHSSSDEYIPIEHVFDDSNKKRVRLLNPYILRLRREQPYEAYKLIELDTFSGLLTTSNDETYQMQREVKRDRLERDIRVDYTDKEDWIVNDTNETNNTRRCTLSKLDSKSSKQRQRKKRFVRRTQENPFEDILQSPEPYYESHDALNYNVNKLNLESKIFTENSQSQNLVDRLEGTENKFHLYEVGDPNVLFKAQVQLLEKLSMPDGKTIWKDLTKRESVRISSLSPDWCNQDVNIRYRCLERVPREYFTLRSTGICLLLPQDGNLNDGFSKDKLGDFIIVPFEDINDIKESNELNSNVSINSAPDLGGKSSRRMVVRLSRALFGRNEDNFVIITEESGKYLRIPFKHQHRAQIEFEAKADENQLVYVGSSGRLTTAVSESTRRTKSVLTVQVTNTGLAAARLRPKIRECTPELLEINEDELGIAVKPILIPPMHTHKFCLEIPLEMPGDLVHCSVALLNDGDESIAVRDVRIKRGDRCFCVWHCQCVCLNEDPKLLCQEMVEYQQVAAGLAPRDRPRQVRAACYPDVVTVNLLVIAFGVLLLLIMLGFVKASLGLIFRCVGSWGIDQMLQTPRRLDQYYERSLRCRPVVFDEDGWPVHPDTKKRTVRLVSKPMEFILNIIFFVTMPCLILWNSLKQIMSHCKNTGNNERKETRYSSSPQSMQDGKEVNWHRRRRRRHLNKWMSPHAEQLSTDIWRNGLAPQRISPPECMRPLLREDRFRGTKLYKINSPVVDSEQDDTEYVLMQMQNSKRTLDEDLQKFKHSSSIID